MQKMFNWLKAHAQLEVAPIEPGPMRPRKVAIVEGGYLSDRQIRRVVSEHYGLALSLPAGEHSLSGIEPLKDVLTYLVVTDWSCHDLSVLADFTKLTYLDIQRTVPRVEVDLSGLAELREYAGPGVAQCRSVLGVKALESLYLDQSSDDDLNAVVGTIRVLRLERAAANSSVPENESFASLRDLWVTDGGDFDLSTLAGLPELEVVRVWDCRHLKGIAALATCPSLRELSIDGVDVLDNWEAVLSFDVQEVSLTNVNSLPENAASLIPEGRNEWTLSQKD